MAPVLFLAARMAQGHGVSVVVDQLAKRLSMYGIQVISGCLETDGFFDVPAERVEPTVAGVTEIARRWGVRHVIAHTSPFFEILPELPEDLQPWAYEHGDPTPDLFHSDRDERFQIAERKRSHVYPYVGMLAISNFCAHDIGWPSAQVIWNGCDHVKDLGSKGLAESWTRRRGPLRIGTLCRLGPGEAKYKGMDLVPRLADSLHRRQVGIQFEVMGRGSESDARSLRENGIKVHLNASDDDRANYLRELDIFVSLSKWEGFNLPLVEAQALGTPALALDVGAHPEVTPLVFGTLDEIVHQIESYARDPALVELHGNQAYHFVRNRFRWDHAAKTLVAILNSSSSENTTLMHGQHSLETKSASRSAFERPLVKRGIQSLRRDGAMVTLRRLRRVVARRFRS